MNNKGFTLTEILLVIVLMVTISLTSIIGLNEIQNKSNEKELNLLIEDIKAAAEVYMGINKVNIEDLLNNTGKSKCIRIHKLQDEGYLKENLVNPMNKEKIPGDLCVYATEKDGEIVYTFDVYSEE